jgi:outer membrane protein OmpA-like peptidoglycan-associated protein
MPSCSAAARSLAVAVATLGAGMAAAQPAVEIAPTATVPFVAQSADIGEASRGVLDSLARSLAERGVRQIELRGYATGDDADDARRVAMARVLGVRSYLIDQGVKARIDVAANGTSARLGARERVDVLLP